MRSKQTNALGRRCSIGCETWPNESEYSWCPICGEPTRIYRGIEPLSPEAALSARRHAEFEDFYENEWTPDEKPITDPELEEMLGVPLYPEKKITPNEDDLLLVKPAKSRRMPLRGGTKVGGGSGFG